MKEMRNEELQLIADEIVEFSIKKKPSEAKREGREINCINGKKINIPIWFLEINGHDLVEFYEAEFPEIIGLKKGKKLSLLI